MKKTLYMIGNAHIDPVWLWRWQDGFSEIRATFRSALDRMKEFPDFVFTSASVSYYAWIEQNDPDMFEEIRQRVAEGKWVITGGWWIQPDCNIPSGESFARQALIGQRYLLEKFGITASTGYNVDSFGHAGTLPKILKKCRITRYVFMRPGPHEKGLPARLFDWQSPDGETVAAFRIPFSYCTGPNDINRQVTSCAQECSDDSAVMCFYGVGNHGGGPTIENICCIHNLQSQDNMTLIMSSPDRFFDDVQERPRPVVCGDLLHHASGCYSAHSQIKQLNRTVENRLLNAEKWSCVALSLFGKRYPLEDYDWAWKKLLFNQFHDILAGTSITEAYDDARDDLGFSLSVAGSHLNDAMQRIARAVDIPFIEGARPYIAFNHQAFDIMAPLEVESASIPDNMVLVDDRGAVVPFQRRCASAASNGRCLLSFIAKVPALGYRLFSLRPADSVQVVSISTTPCDLLENEYLRVSFCRETGAIQSLFYKTLAQEMLREPTKVQVIKDQSDTWAHGVFSFSEVEGQMQFKDIACIDNGPVCKTIRVQFVYQNSLMIQEYTLYHKLPVLYVKVMVNWQGASQALKLRFAVCHNNTCVTAQEPFGFAQHELTGFEFPMQQWVDISGVNGKEATGTSGLAILNDGKYSYDAHDRALHITVLRSPCYAHHEPFVIGEDNAYPVIDQGWQTFRYALVPHDGLGSDGTIDRAAMLFNTPPTVLPESFHAGTMPGAYSFARLEGGTVVLDALKAAQDGSDTLIVHAHESALRASETRLVIPALSVDYKLTFAPGQIRVLRISLKQPENISEVDLLEL